MLKTPFTPYSEKLRQATERRRAAQGSSQSKKTSIEVGSHAPDFTLYNSANEQVSLHDVIKKSNVVLLFFPLAFTDVCTQELCSVRDNMSKYERLHATVLGISVDSMFALNQFKKEKHYQFDLLSDFNKEVARQYHALYDDFPLFHMKGVTKRAAFVVDRQGLIQHVDILADPGQVPNFKAIEQALSKCNEGH